MTQILQPEVSLTLASADLEVANTAQKVLIVGQLVGSPDATAGDLQEEIGGDRAEDALFGRTSNCATMVRQFKDIAPQVQVDAIALADGTTPRVFTITFAGTATEAGSIVINVGSERNHSITVDIADTDAAAAVATAASTAINLDLDCPFTASPSTADLVLTADQSGVTPNTYPIGVVGNVAGITSTQVETTPGAGDPALASTIFDVIGEKRYQAIVWPFAAKTVVKDFLDGRFNVTNRVQDGVAYCHSVDSYANLGTELDALNSQSLIVNSDKLEDETNYDGPSVPEQGEVKSARLAAIVALRLTPDTAISRFITSTASKDQFGGTALASLPYFNTIDPGMPLVKTGRGFTDIEVAGLHDSGGYVMGVNSAGNTGIVGEVVTTYKTDGGGNDDLTWKYLNYVHTGSNVREYMFNNLKKRFAQSRLTEGSVSRGRDMVNELVFRAYCEKLYADLSEPDFVLTQDGEQALLYFKQNLDVSLDLSLGKITSTMFVPIVTQTRIILATIKISFSTEG